VRVPSARCRPNGGHTVGARSRTGVTPRRRAAGGTVALWVAVAWMAAAASVAGPAAASGAATTSTSTTTAPSEPPLDSVVLAQTLPGFSPVAPGPTNGALTAVEFASQSSDPHAATAEFTRLAAQPGFGAFIRLWTDRDGPGHGANDIAVLLFRIPGAAAPQAFTDGLLSAFDDSHATQPFAVPSIAGAHGYSIPVTSPLAATEQVVVFRTGRYVSMLQLASTSAASNPTTLGRAQAISLSYQQYQTIHVLDPAGAAAPTAGRPGTAPGGTTGHPATPAVATPPARSTDTAAVTGLVLVACAALGAGVWLVLRRRRAVPAAVTDHDPWGPDGILAQFGAVDPWAADPGGAPAEGPAHGSPDVLRAAVGARPPARAVPALVPDLSDDPDAAGPDDTPATTGGLGAVVSS
jgi:hypothetical protein